MPELDEDERALQRARAFSTRTTRSVGIANLVDADENLKGSDSEDELDEGSAISSRRVAQSNNDEGQTVGDFVQQEEQNQLDYEEPQ